MKIPSLILFVFLFCSCTQDKKGSGPSNSSGQCPSNSVTSAFVDKELDIYQVPSFFGSVITSEFDRYTKIQAPNCENIHIIAQNGVSNEKMVRARKVMEHYLTNLPGSEYGSNKANLMNQITKNKCVLTLFNGKDDVDGEESKEQVGLALAKAGFSNQDLFALEMQIEGGPWYMAQNYQYRDATYEV